MRFRRKPSYFEAEQFFASANPDTYHDGVKWGGDLPDGMGCYVVVTAHGHPTPIADSDWIVPEPNGNGHYPVKAEIMPTIADPA